MTRRDLLKLAATAGTVLATRGGARAQESGEPVMGEGQPKIVSTWQFGLPANERAFARLLEGADALDAVVEGVAVCELDPTVRTVGLGGYPTSEGVVQLDASVMHGPTRRCGAVAALEGIATPAAVARRVMTETDHLLLVGAGARAFALSQGFEDTELLTEEMRRELETWRAHRRPPPEDVHDTIGMLAIDQRGTLSGACTTSGTPWKLPGRVGDSPLIGAGLYVDGEVGGATATGRGEDVIRVSGSFLIVELMRAGWSPQAACEEACDRIVRNYPGETPPGSAFLALRVDGEVGAAGVRRGYFRYALSDIAGGHRLLEAPGRV